MPTINQLNSVDNPSASDLLPLYSQSNGDARKLSLSNLLNFIGQSFASPEFFTQYSTPGASGYNIQVNDSSQNTWLVISSLSTYATGAITLPAVGNCVDGQEVLVNFTNAVTSFTVNGNGAVQVIGAPTTISASGYFRMRYMAQAKIWFRVG